MGRGCESIKTLRSRAEFLNYIFLYDEEVWLCVFEPVL